MVKAKTDWIPSLDPSMDNRATGQKGTDLEQRKQVEIEKWVNRLKRQVDGRLKDSEQKREKLAN